MGAGQDDAELPAEPKHFPLTSSTGESLGDLVNPSRQPLGLRYLMLQLPQLAATATVEVHAEQQCLKFELDDVVVTEPKKLKPYIFTMAANGRPSPLVEWSKFLEDWQQDKFSLSLAQFQQRLRHLGYPTGADTTVPLVADGNRSKTENLDRTLYALSVLRAATRGTARVNATAPERPDYLRLTSETADGRSAAPAWVASPNFPEPARYGTSWLVQTLAAAQLNGISNLRGSLASAQPAADLHPDLTGAAPIDSGHTNGCTFDFKWTNNPNNPSDADKTKATNFLNSLIRDDSPLTVGRLYIANNFSPVGTPLHDRYSATNVQVAQSTAIPYAHVELIPKANLLPAGGGFVQAAQPNPTLLVHRAAASLELFNYLFFQPPAWNQALANAIGTVSNEYEAMLSGNSTIVNGEQLNLETLLAKRHLVIDLPNAAALPVEISSRLTELAQIAQNATIPADLADRPGFRFDPEKAEIIVDLPNLRIAPPAMFAFETLRRSKTENEAASLESGLEVDFRVPVDLNVTVGGSARLHFTLADNEFEIRFTDAALSAEATASDVAPSSHSPFRCGVLEIGFPWIDALHYRLSYDAFSSPNPTNGEAAFAAALLGHWNTKPAKFTGLNHVELGPVAKISADFSTSADGNEGVQGLAEEESLKFVVKVDPSFNAAQDNRKEFANLSPSALSTAQALLNEKAFPAVFEIDDELVRDYVRKEDGAITRTSIAVTVSGNAITATALEMPVCVIAIKSPSEWQLKRGDVVEKEIRLADHPILQRQKIVVDPPSDSNVRSVTLLETADADERKRLEPFLVFSQSSLLDLVQSIGSTGELLLQESTIGDTAGAKPPLLPFTQQPLTDLIGLGPMFTDTLVPRLSHFEIPVGAIEISKWDAMAPSVALFSIAMDNHPVVTFTRGSLPDAPRPNENADQILVRRLNQIVDQRLKEIDQELKKALNGALLFTLNSQQKMVLRVNRRLPADSLQVIAGELPLGPAVLRSRNGTMPGPGSYSFSLIVNGQAHSCEIVVVAGDNAETLRKKMQDVVRALTEPQAEKISFALLPAINGSLMEMHCNFDTALQSVELRGADWLGFDFAPGNIFALRDFQPLTLQAIQAALAEIHPGLHCALEYVKQDDKPKLRLRFQGLNFNRQTDLAVELDRDTDLSPFADLRVAGRLDARFSIQAGIAFDWQLTNLNQNNLVVAGTTQLSELQTDARLKKILADCQKESDREYAHRIQLELTDRKDDGIAPASFTVDLTKLADMADLKKRIEDACLNADGKKRVQVLFPDEAPAIADKTRLRLVDLTVGKDEGWTQANTVPFRVSMIDGSPTGTALGIVGSDVDGDGILTTIPLHGRTLLDQLTLNDSQTKLEIEGSIDLKGAVPDEVGQPPQFLKGQVDFGPVRLEFSGTGNSQLVQKFTLEPVAGFDLAPFSARAVRNRYLTPALERVSKFRWSSSTADAAVRFKAKLAIFGGSLTTAPQIPEDLRALFKSFVPEGDGEGEADILLSWNAAARQVTLKADQFGPLETWTDGAAIKEAWGRAITGFLKVMADLETKFPKASVPGIALNLPGELKLEADFSALKTKFEAELANLKYLDEIDALMRKNVPFFEKLKYDSAEKSLLLILRRQREISLALPFNLQSADRALVGVNRQDLPQGALSLDLLVGLGVDFKNKPRPFLECETTSITSALNVTIPQVINVTLGSLPIPIGQNDLKLTGFPRKLIEQKLPDDPPPDGMTPDGRIYLDDLANLPSLNWTFDNLAGISLEFDGDFPLPPVPPSITNFLPRLGDDWNRLGSRIREKLLAVLKRRSLPIFGDNIGDLLDVFDGIDVAFDGSWLNLRIPSADREAYRAAVRTELEKALRAALSNFDQITFGDITVTLAAAPSLEIEEIRVQFKFSRTQLQQSDLVLGLDGLGLEISPSPTVETGVTLTMGGPTGEFGTFGFDKAGLYFENTRITLEAGATIRDNGARTDLGFLRFHTKFFNNPTGGQESGASLKLEIPLTEQPGKVRLDGLMSATPSIALTTWLGLSLESEQQGVLPRFRTTLSFLWSCQGRGTDWQVSRPPQVDFGAVQMHVGDFADAFLKPIADKVTNLAGPVFDLRDKLETPLPVLSDLGGKITLFDLALLFCDDTESIEDFREALSKLAGVRTQIERVKALAGDDGWVNVGSFTLDGADVLDPGKRGRMSPGPAGPDLPQAQLKLADLSNALNQEQEPPELDSKNKFSRTEGRFYIPILEGIDDGHTKQSPERLIFNLLLGNDVPMFEYRVPKLKYEFEYSQFFPIIGPLGARFGGRCSAEAGIAFGYDTSAVRQHRPAMYGFYLNDRNGLYGSGDDVAEVTLMMGLFAAGEVNVGVARAGVEGGIVGKLEFNLNDCNYTNPDGFVYQANDGRIYFEEVVNTPPLKLFQITAEVYSYLKWYIKIAEFKIFGKSICIFCFENEFLRQRLLYFDGGGCGSNQVAQAHTAPGAVAFVPVPDPISTGGGDGVTGDGGPIFDGSDANGGADGAALKEPIVISGGANIEIRVSPDGLMTEHRNGEFAHSFAKSRYEGAVLIFKGTDAPERVVIGPGVQNQIELHGGGGNDELIHNGEGSALINGGPGNDKVLGSRNPDKTDTIFGNEGDDDLDGREGRDKLSGGPGNDVVAGGPGDDLVAGDDGNDLLNGMAGNDWLFGGMDADTLLGQAGNDVLVGGPGADKLGFKSEPEDETTKDETGDDILVGDDLKNAPQSSSLTEAILQLNFTTNKYDQPPALAADVINQVQDVHRLSPAVLILHEPTDNLKYWSLASEDQKKLAEVQNRIAGYILGATDGDVLQGGPGSDVAMGSNGKGRLLGGVGNDWIWGGSSADVVDGRDGDDVLFGGDGPDEIGGDAGADVVVGGGHSDRLFAGERSQADEVDARDFSQNEIYGDEIEPHLNVADDLKEFGIDPAAVRRGVGDDLMVGGVGVNFITAGGGQNRIITEKPDGDGFKPNAYDVVLCGDQRDVVHAGAGQLFVYAGQGDNEIIAFTTEILNLTQAKRTHRTAAYIIAGSGKDRISTVGHPGDGWDGIWGKPPIKNSENEDEYIWTATVPADLDGRRDLCRGKVELRVGAGENRIWTGNGPDRIVTEEGPDLIFAGLGEVDVKAGAGDNRIVAEAKRSQPDEDGKVLSLGGETPVVSINTGTGVDWISTIGLISNDFNVRRANFTLPTRIQCAGGDNTLWTGDGFDSVITAGGSDTAYLGKGRFDVQAGDGRNRIVAAAVTDAGEPAEQRFQIVTGSDADQISTIGKFADDPDRLNQFKNDVTIDAGPGDNEIWTGNGADSILAGAKLRGSPDLNIPGKFRTALPAEAIESRELTGRNEIHAGAGANAIHTGNGENQIWIIPNGEESKGHINHVSTGSGQDRITTVHNSRTFQTPKLDDVNVRRKSQPTQQRELSEPLEFPEWYEAARKELNTFKLNLIDAGDGVNCVLTGAGDDWIKTGLEQDVVNASQGRNSVDVGRGDNYVELDKTASSGKYNIVIYSDGNDEYQVPEGDVNDFVVAGKGLDKIYAGAGDDFILAGDGNDVIHGQDGDDIIIGGVGDDILSGGPGSDVVIGGNGNMHLNGVVAGVTLDQLLAEAIELNSLGAPTDSDEYNKRMEAFGKKCADLAAEFRRAPVAAPGVDTALAEVQTISLEYWTTGYTLPLPEIAKVVPKHLFRFGSLEGDNGDGRDYLLGGEGNDFLFGGAEIDLLFGGNGCDYLDAGAGNDELYGVWPTAQQAEKAKFNAANGFTLAKGYPSFAPNLPANKSPGQNDDVLLGGFGDDLLSGGWGLDQLYGDEGDDYLFGDQGVEVEGQTVQIGQRLWGGPGVDRLHAFCTGINPDNDAILFGDELRGGGGGDYLFGSLRRELLIGDSLNAPLAGNDYLHGDYFKGDYAISLEAGWQGGADILYGNRGSDQLFGGGGNDVLWGGQDNDWLEGMGGVDRLHGGSGPDLLIADVDSRYPNNPDGSQEFTQGHWGNVREADSLDDAVDILVIQGDATFVGANPAQPNGNPKHDLIVVQESSKEPETNLRIDYGTYSDVTDRSPS